MLFLFILQIHFLFQSQAQILFNALCNSSTELSTVSNYKLPGSTVVVSDPLRTGQNAFSFSSLSSSFPDLVSADIPLGSGVNLQSRLQFCLEFDYLGLGYEFYLASTGVVQQSTNNKYIDPNAQIPQWKVQNGQSLTWSWLSDVNDIYFSCFDNQPMVTATTRLFIVFYGWGNTQIQFSIDQGFGLQLQQYWLAQLPLPPDQNIFYEYSVSVDAVNDQIHMWANATNFSHIYQLPIGFFSSTGGVTYCSIGQQKDMLPAIHIKYLHFNKNEDFGLRAGIKTTSHYYNLSANNSSPKGSVWQRAHYDFYASTSDSLVGTDVSDILNNPSFNLILFDYNDSSSPFRKSGDFLFSNIQLVICDISCRTCSGAGTDNCISCDAPIDHRWFIQRQSKEIFGILSDIGMCVCQTEFFSQLGQRICAACHVSCQTCSGPSEKDCLSCPQIAYRQDRSADTDTGARCPCMRGFTDDYIVINKVVIPQRLCRYSCFYTCATCTGDNYYSCLTCKNGRGQLSYQGDPKKKETWIFSSILNTCECVDDYEESQITGECSDNSKAIFYLARSVIAAIIIQLIISVIIALFTGKTLFYLQAVDQFQQLSQLFYINVHFPGNFSKLFALLNYFNFFNYCMPNFSYMIAGSAELLVRVDSSKLEHTYPAVSSFVVLQDQNTFTKFQLNGKTNNFLTNCGALIEFTLCCWLIVLILKKIAPEQNIITVEKDKGSQIKRQVVLDEEQENEIENRKQRTWLEILRDAFYLKLPIFILRLTSGELILCFTLQLHGGVSFANGLNTISIFFLIISVYYFVHFIKRLLEVCSLVIPYGFCHDKHKVKPYIKALFDNINIDQRNWGAQYWFILLMLKKILLSFFTVVSYDSAIAQSVMLFLIQLAFTAFIILKCPYKERKQKILYCIQEFLQLIVYIALMVFVSGQDSLLPYNSGVYFLFAMAYLIIVYHFLLSIVLFFNEWPTLEAAFNRMNNKEPQKINYKNQIVNPQQQQYSSEKKPTMVIPDNR